MSATNKPTSAKRYKKRLNEYFNEIREQKIRRENPPDKPKLNEIDSEQNLSFKSELMRVLKQRKKSLNSISVPFVQ